MGNAIARADNYSCSQAGLTHINFVSEDQVRQEWKAVVLPFTRKQLAELAGVTTQAAGHWHNGDRSPNTATLFNLARSLPSIQTWGIERMGASRAAQCMSIDEIERALHSIAARDDEEGRTARQLLIASYAIRAGGEETVPPLVRVAWGEIDKKIRGA